MENQSVLHFAALGVFLIGVVISVYYRRKADRETGERVSPRSEGLPIMISLRIFGLTLWASIFAYLIHPGWMDWSKLELPIAFRWFGLALGLAADVFAYWIFSNLGNNISPTVSTRRTHQLITSGPYRWIRHPLYTMGLLAHMGFAFLAANWFIALLAICYFFVLFIRLPQEEAHLMERYGEEYENYIKRTGKFIPRWDRERHIQ